MSNSIKTVTFIESDRELVKQIEAYQHKHELNSFIDAVRKLCENSMEIEKIQNKR